MKAKVDSRVNGTRRARLVAAGLALAAAGAFAVQGDAAMQTDTADEIRGLQQAYTELRSQTSLEQKELAETRVFLEEEISLLEQRIASLKESTDALVAERGDTADKRVELEKEEAALKAGTRSLEEAIVGLESRFLALRATLPDLLLEQVNRVARNIPKDAADAEAKKLDLYTRYVQVVGGLNFIDNFNDDLKLTTASVRIPSIDKDVQVTAIYLGMGQAYYIDQTGKYAGTGRPTPDGFQWTPDDSIAPQIALLKEIYEGQKPAQFVQVPANVE